MRAQNINKQLQMQYILECRSSGLTDYQWCKEHGIHPGTFYNWVSKLKKNGCKNIPDPISRLGHKPIPNEIVKLDIAPDKSVVDNLPLEIEQNACFSQESIKDSVVEIVLNNATIRFINNTDASLFNQTLKYLGGGLC